MLPARYHRLRNRTMATVDRTFAEPVKLSFYAMGDMKRYLDPARPPREIEAILCVGDGETTSARGGANAWRIRITAQKGELHIDRNRYPDIPVRTGDRVQALSRPGQPLFNVVAVDDRGASRLVLQLAEA